MNKSRAQIIGTIGPASQDRENISQMIDSQMDVVRLNFSWGDYDSYQKNIEDIRSLAEEKGLVVPIIQDLSGPRIQEEGSHKFDSDSTSPITEKDKKDLEFGSKNNLEYVALSFVGSASDVEELKSVLNELNYSAKIIAKIERQKAIDNFDEILNSADAIMIARGDLGNEVPIEKIPFVQADLIKKANTFGKPVIVATEMLPSMIENNIPTRSDVSDVSNAILQGADVLMMSNETAVGKYPVESVKVMEKIVLEAEGHVNRGYNLL